MSEFIHGDSFNILNAYSKGSFDLVIADPPYGYPELMNFAINKGRELSRGAVIVFSYPEDVYDFKTRPDQICHWVKPISTKNTIRKYSRFVEAISIWHGDFFNNELHWSTRSGVFTDGCISQQVHPFEKPESLIHKLLLLHCKKGGLVLDPFAGSGTVAKVGTRLGYDVTSIEVDAQWSHL